MTFVSEGKNTGDGQTFKAGDKCRLVQIRNPWASGEWVGDWHDDDEKWNAIKARGRIENGFFVFIFFRTSFRPLIEPDQKAKYHSSDDDGCFWMSWDSWTHEFETLDICYMPDEE